MAAGSLVCTEWLVKSACWRLTVSGCPVLPSI